ncbi:hypothetical protein [Atribacter laminatus]|uniref:Uncharacterized protein n=1 Tax=Atribacter laminatus TaxID=2847778 RepID=A0A7T1AJH4_ATRLM|nr:hypothetical protein [Atribacter laminatus]QPM67047.1 hypothetical protein RT761_00235 [Atribacter laminatus]
MNIFKENKGSILITVISLIAIITVLIGVGSTLVISGNKKVHSTSNKTQAHYVAEAGIEEVISNPFLINKVLKSFNIFYNPSNPTTPAPSPPWISLIEKPFPLNFENNKTGTYSVEGKVDPDSIIFANGVPQEVKIKITSEGTIINSKNDIISIKEINCRIKVDLVTFYNIGLKNAIATSNSLNSGKVYIELDSGVTSPANVYSNANITNIAGTIPGSIYARGGEVIIDNNTIVNGDVVASGRVQLNNNAQVDGKVVSSTSYVDVNNNATVAGDTVGYGVDKKGNSVNLVNSSVHNVYTNNGESSFNSKNSNYNSIQILPAEPNYPADYPIPDENLPIITDEIRDLWIKQAQSEGNIINGDFNLTTDQAESISTNTFIDGNLILENNAILNIEKDALIFITGYIQIENNAVINGTGSLVTDDYFIIKNNSIPTSISLIALGSTTDSQLTNNSATTGAILVPNGNLVINNQANIHGGVFAKSIPSIGNNAKIVFNPKLNQNLPPTQNTTEVLTLESWTEDINSLF